MHENIASTDRFWRIEIYQDDGVTSVLDYNGGWTVAGNADGKTSQIGLRAGIYYIKIKYEPYKHSAVTYTLRVNFTESDLTEYEPNSRVSKATPIQVNEEYMGALAGSDDVDWYQFSTPADGYIKVYFDHEVISSTDCYWKLYIFRDDGVSNVLDYDGYWCFAGNVNDEISQIGLPAGTYYIKIQYNPYRHSDIIYRMRIAYEETDKTELEPNSAPSKATEIGLNTDYAGAIAGDNDADWYRFTLPSLAQVTLNFNHALIDSTSNYWNLYLYSSDGVTQLSSYSVAGNNNGSFDVGELEEGVYYAKITYCPYNSSDVTYTLNVSEKHDCVGTWVIRTEPTCTADGQREEICSICGTLMKTESVPAYGHTSSDWTVGKEATCTEGGYLFATCERCNEDVQENTDPKPHQYGVWGIISGSKLIPPIVKEQTCTQCGYVNTIKDWSYIWVPILAVAAVVLFFAAVVSLCRKAAARRKRRKIAKKTSALRSNVQTQTTSVSNISSSSNYKTEKQTSAKPNTEVQSTRRR